MDEVELALDWLDVLGLIVAEIAETRSSMANCVELIKGKGKGRILSATLSYKIHSYSLVRGTFTIMWM